MLLGRHPLNGVTLYCRDLDAAMRFYHEVLELPVLEEAGLVHLDAGAVRIVLHPVDASRELKPRGSYLVFLIRDDLRGVCEELERRGIDVYTSVGATPVGELASFRDPDGHLIYLWRPEPGEERYAKVVEHHERLARLLDLSSGRS